MHAILMNGPKRVPERIAFEHRPGGIGRTVEQHEKQIRALAVARSIPCFTTIPAAAAAVSAVERLLSDALEVEALQDVLG